MSSTRQLGDHTTNITKQGEKYEIRFFVLASDYDAYKYEYGDNTDAIFGFTGGTNSYCYEWQDEDFADHWLVTIRACNEDYDWGGTDDDPQIGNLRISEDDKGLLYTVQERMTTAQHEIFIANAKHFAIDLNVYHSGISANKAYVYKWEDRKVTPVNSQDWIVTFYAYDVNYDWNGGTLSIRHEVGQKAGRQYIYKYLVHEDDHESIMAGFAYGDDGFSWARASDDYLFAWEDRKLGSKKWSPTSRLGNWWVITLKVCNKDYDWGNTTTDEDPQMGVLKMSEDDKGILYTVQERMTNNEHNTFLAGVKAFAIDLNVYHSGISANTAYIYRWEDRKVTPVDEKDWIVTFHAYDVNYDWNGGTLEIRHENGQKAGRQYTYKYLIHENDHESAMAGFAYGQNGFSWARTSTDYLFAWEDRKLGSKKWSPTSRLGNWWVITLKVCNKDYDWGTIDNNNEKIDSYITRKRDARGMLISKVEYMTEAELTAFNDLQNPFNNEKLAIDANTWFETTAGHFYIYNWESRRVSAYDHDSNPATENKVYAVTLNACSALYDWSGQGLDIVTETGGEQGITFEKTIAFHSSHYSTYINSTTPAYGEVAPWARISGAYISNWKLRKSPLNALHDYWFLTYTAKVVFKQDNGGSGGTWTLGGNSKLDIISVSQYDYYFDPYLHACIKKANKDYKENDRKNVDGGDILEGAYIFAGKDGKWDSRRSPLDNFNDNKLLKLGTTEKANLYNLKIYKKVPKHSVTGVSISRITNKFNSFTGIMSRSQFLNGASVSRSALSGIGDLKAVSQSINVETDNQTGDMYVVIIRSAKSPPKGERWKK